MRTHTDDRRHPPIADRHRAQLGRIQRGPRGVIFAQQTLRRAGNLQCLSIDNFRAFLQGQPPITRDRDQSAARGAVQAVRERLGNRKIYRRLGIADHLHRQGHIQPLQRQAGPSAIKQIERFEIALQTLANQLARTERPRPVKQGACLGKITEIGFLQSAVEIELAWINRGVALAFGAGLQSLEIGRRFRIFAAQIAAIPFNQGLLWLKALGLHPGKGERIADRRARRRDRALCHPPLHDREKRQHRGIFISAVAFRNESELALIGRQLGPAKT